MTHIEKPSFEHIQAFHSVTHLPYFNLDNKVFPLAEIRKASENMGYLVVNQPFAPDGLSVVANNKGEVVFNNLGLVSKTTEIRDKKMVWHWDSNGRLVGDDLYVVSERRISIKIVRYFYDSDGGLLKQKEGWLESGMKEETIHWHESIAEPPALEENVLLQELIAAKGTKTLTEKLKSIPLENIEELKRVAESWLEDLTGEIEAALEEKENLQQELAEVDEDNPEERKRLRDEIKSYDITQEEKEKKQLELIITLLPPC